MRKRKENNLKDRTMDEDIRREIAASLHQTYLPTRAPGKCCIICGNDNADVFLHAIECSFDDSIAFPSNFVPMTRLGNWVRGSFPVCVSCSKPCRKCGISIPSDTLMEKIAALQKQYPQADVVSGNGICFRHIHLSVFFKALFKRIFGIGRFSR